MILRCHARLNKLRPLFLLALVVLVLCPTTSWAGSRPLPQIEWQLVETYPHTPSAFTQGLELHGNTLYESSGLYGYSRLLARRFPPDNSVENALRGVALPEQFFAEGLSLYQGKLYLLTWRSGKGLILDPAHFGVLGTFEYQGEGWGLCYHPSQNAFALSDGSHTIQWKKPADFAPNGEINIHYGKQRFDKLNELECHKDYILANRWKHNSILVIDAASGEVRGELDLSTIVKAEASTWTAQNLPVNNRAEAVLNGIAYDASDNSWLVGGKLWRHLYRIKFELPDIRLTRK